MRRITAPFTLNNVKLAVNNNYDDKRNKQLKKTKQRNFSSPSSSP